MQMTRSINCQQSPGISGRCLTAVGATFAHTRTKFSLQVKKLGQQG